MWSRFLAPNRDAHSWRHTQLGLRSKGVKSADAVRTRVAPTAHMSRLGRASRPSARPLRLASWGCRGRTAIYTAQRHPDLSLAVFLSSTGRSIRIMFLNVVCCVFLMGCIMTVRDGLSLPPVRPAAQVAWSSCRPLQAHLSCELSAGATSPSTLCVSVPSTGWLNLGWPLRVPACSPGPAPALWAT